ncbi:MAG TPA: hypothetical protein VFB76_09775, partial [Candidatus Angelobacter sp.]|nr:hypothetical protein [Candidatus Angelobacter sp.]
MRVLPKLGFLVLAAGMALAQSGGDGGGQGQNSSVADELKSLREAITSQQAQISQQQQQIQNLQQQLQEKTSGTPRMADAALHNTAAPATTATNTNTVVQETEKPKESPLSFRIGGTEFTPGGFVDFENVFRSTNTGGNITTPFGGIPFSNTVQGHLTEFRTTGQYSRYNLKITGHYGENNVTGYLEGDFNGNDATNVFVTSNPHTNRLRLYWLDLKRGNWEFLGGQSWGLQTPNRVGLSPAPADLAVTLNEDANINVGIPYTRAGLFRAVYHFNDNFQWGVEMQNPDQFTTGGVLLPAAFSAQLGPQLDGANGTNATGVPSAFPDLHTKFAWDTGRNGRHFHFEAGGILTSAKITVLAPSNTPTASFVHNTGIGGTFHGAFNFELFKGFRILANGMWGTGAGRYMIGLGPQVVVVPISGPGSTCTIVGTTATGCSADVSMVHAGAMTIGSELQAGKKTQFGFYYGGNYFQRNAFTDISSTLAVQPTIGFGGLNSPNSANRAIQEGTIDWTQTFWKSPQYGAVLLITQASYLTRAPWFVAAGAPKNAHLMLGYV